MLWPRRAKLDSRRDVDFGAQAHRLTGLGLQVQVSKDDTKGNLANVPVANRDSLGLGTMEKVRRCTMAVSSHEEVGVRPVM